MAVTLQDIARELNVSVVTVSKVLRNEGKISTATRNRVLRRAKELNYQPNWVARSLVTRRTWTIGLLLPDFTHPFFAEIAKAVAETFRPRGYHVIISYFEEDPVLERNEAESLLARQVDGLVIASAQPLDDRTMFKGIRDREVPFVLIDRPIAGVQASFVGVDNEAIGELATNHLIARGCHRIAHLRGPKIGIAEARLAGYRRALETHTLPAPAQYLVQAGYDDSGGYEGMRRLLYADPIPDGVFCYNDPVAIGALRAISQAGLNVPQDIAVIGAGNVRYSDVLSVPLSSVDQGTGQIGQRAAALLLKQIESKRKLNLKEILIPPKLIARASTRRSPQLPSGAPSVAGAGAGAASRIVP
jgi:LacI family transcriptional regulator